MFAQSMFAARDFNAALGPNSSQNISYGGRADRDDSDEYGEPSSSASDTDEEDDDSDKEE